MFGIGISELVLIAIVALIVVGPKNLPVTLRAIGRAIGEFKRATRELRQDVGFDQVVDEVTRPLREGMSAIEKDVKDVERDVRSMDEPARAIAVVGEYPDGGPDDYGALPEIAPSYPSKAPVLTQVEAKRIEKTIPRGARGLRDDEG